MHITTDIISVFVKWSAYVAAGQRLKRYDVFKLGAEGPNMGQLDSALMDHGEVGICHSMKF
jgi:hypothetical protein